MFLGAVPLARLRRFRDDFRPERSPDGRRVVRALSEQWRADGPPRLWVYPQGDVFMVSDDYLALAALERGWAEVVPCWILGAVSDGDLGCLRGPVDPRGLRRMGVH